jgi:NAD(P)-dependent dehydrogenase (short-subunit alcohol dehydrogenase family)
MKIDLSGKTALVTGSTAGIGHAIAKGLAGTGASVIVNGRGETKVNDAVAKLCATTGARVGGIAADVSTAEGCKALIAALPEVDILINNAGIFAPKNFVEIPDEDWERLFNVNVMSGVRLSRAYLPGMLTRNWGRIIFISSESGLNIPADMIHYGMTKTAQLAVSRGLAKLTRGTAVTVNSVLPGPTMSEGVETMLNEVARRSGQSELAVAALCQRRRDRQHGGLYRVKRILGHQRRGAARRRRHRELHCVRWDDRGCSGNGGQGGPQSKTLVIVEFRLRQRLRECVCIALSMPKRSSCGAPRFRGRGAGLTGSRLPVGVGGRRAGNRSAFLAPRTQR